MIHIRCHHSVITAIVVLKPPSSIWYRSLPGLLLRRDTLLNWMLYIKNRFQLQKREIFDRWHWQSLLLQNSKKITSTSNAISQANLSASRLHLQVQRKRKTTSSKQFNTTLDPYTYYLLRNRRGVSNTTVKATFGFFFFFRRSCFFHFFVFLTKSPAYKIVIGIYLR